MSIVKDALDARSDHGTRWLLTRGPQYLEEIFREQLDESLETFLSDSAYYATCRYWYLQQAAPTDIRDYNVPLDPYQVMHFDPHKITHKT